MRAVHADRPAAAQPRLAKLQRPPRRGGGDIGECRQQRIPYRAVHVLPAQRRPEVGVRDIPAPRRRHHMTVGQPAARRRSFAPRGPVIVDGDAHPGDKARCQEHGEGCEDEGSEKSDTLHAQRIIACSTRRQPLGQNVNPASGRGGATQPGTKRIRRRNRDPLRPRKLTRSVERLSAWLDGATLTVPTAALDRRRRQIELRGTWGTLCACMADKQLAIGLALNISNLGLLTSSLAQETIAYRPRRADLTVATAS